MSSARLPSITCPGSGGVESTTNPSDVAEEQRSAVLQAVMVTKYTVPSTSCTMSISTSSNGI